MDKLFHIDAVCGFCSATGVIHHSNVRPWNDMQATSGCLDIRVRLPEGWARVMWGGTDALAEVPAGVALRKRGFLLNPIDSDFVPLPPSKE